MADEEKEVKESKSSGGLLSVINLVLLVLLLGVGGFNAWTLMQLQATPAAAPAAQSEQQPKIPEAEDETDAPPILMDLNDITVNLADADQNRFLRAKVKLEVRGEEAKAKVSENMVKINDLILTILASKKFSDIRTPQGKYALKEDLVYRMNRLIGGKPIKNLYFTDFVSQ